MFLTPQKKEQKPTIGRKLKGKDNIAQSTKAPPVSDIRAKYAQKLKQKTESGSLAGIDRAKHQDPNQGDAAGHWAARALVASSGPSNKSGSKWLASTGAGNFLTYLTSRYMKVALLPFLPQKLSVWLAKFRAN